MTTTRLAKLLIALICVGAPAATLAVATPFAHAITGPCAAAYSGPTDTWTGKGDGTRWSDSGNWSTAAVPSATSRVCIGKATNGHRAAVVVTGSRQVAGLVLADHADLTVKPGAVLLLSAPTGAPLTSTITSGTRLKIAAGTLGGASPLVVSGTLRFTGQDVAGHRDLAIQTGSGQTEIARGGAMLVDGTTFGGTELSHRRTIDNLGTVTFTGNGYVAMDRGTGWSDEAHSTIKFQGVGGIYPRAAGSGSPATLLQRGALVRNKSGTNVVVVGVPVDFGAHPPKVAVIRGSIVVNHNSVPVAPVGRSSGYGVGSCTLVTTHPCKRPNATAQSPQVAYAGTSASSGAPRTSHLSVALVNGPATVNGHKVLGKQINVTAPTEKTTHSTHLTFALDATTKGLGAHPQVFRNGRAISLCRVHGLTARNTSCILSEKIATGGGGATKGDLSIVAITIQPNAHWLIAR